MGYTILERDLLMLNPKANHGCPMDTVVMVLVMVLDTEDFMEDIMDTTLESDLLMLSQKASHGWDTDTVGWIRWIRWIRRLWSRLWQTWGKISHQNRIKTMGQNFKKSFFKLL